VHGYKSLNIAYELFAIPQNKKEGKQEDKAFKEKGKGKGE
jgi:hypothetical protein